MNPATHLPFRWICRSILGAIVLMMSVCATSRALAQLPTIDATVKTTNGLSLKDLLKRWENTSLDEVGRQATNGDLTAQHYLGYCHAKGLRVTQSPQLGVVWYERALKGGYLPSANNLGLLYEDGLLGTKDMMRAARYYTFAAERGLAVAQVNLGLLYRSGDGVPHDPETAMRWFRAAADQGSSDGMTQLYYSYWGGKGVPKDHAKALEWLRKAAEANNPRAQYLMGYRCESQEWEGEGENRRLTPKKLLEAFQWHRRAAEQNWPGGLHHLGLCYLEGEVVERDEKRALELIRAAADEELKEAMEDLAALYARGIGEPRDAHDRPMALLHRAGAWAVLQMRYENGLGTPQDFVAAARCHTEKLLSGSSYYHSPEDLVNYVEFKSRQRSLWSPFTGSPDGHCQRQGPSSDQSDVPTDNVLRALSLYLKSAKGDGVSAERIGELYQVGNGAELSLSKAWAWFNIAADNAASTARDKAAKLEMQFGGPEMATAREYLQQLRKDLQQVGAIVKN